VTLTRAERRAAVAHRRSVVALIGSFVAAAVILVAWFPAGALIDQHRTLSETTTSLDHLKVENKALETESKNLSKPSEIARIARQQFQLIVPGEQAYQVLPPPGTAGGATDPYSGDPGNSAPVSPSAAPELPPGTVKEGLPVKAPPSHETTHQRKGATHESATSGSPGLFGRLLRTLEFWR
jgi:cell division protein FtsB